jgi:hypothetical protein
MDKVLHRCIFCACWEFSMCKKTCQKPLSTYGIIGIVSTLLFKLLIPKQIPQQQIHRFNLPSPSGNSRPKGLYLSETPMHQISYIRFFNFDLQTNDLHQTFQLSFSLISEAVTRLI